MPENTCAHIKNAEFCGSGFDQNMQMLDEAFGYCNENFGHEKIISALCCGNDLKKQICIIELNCINNQAEADLLMFHLTEHSGPLRESASFKILELIQNDKYRRFFQTKSIYDIMLKSVTDINPAVSRNACGIIKYADDAEYILNGLISALNKAFEESENTKKQHAYTVNKKNFGIYWNLEALSSAAAKAGILKRSAFVLAAVEKAAAANDYTVREKAAKAACAYKLENIVNMLKSDNNMYVRMQASEC